MGGNSSSLVNLRLIDGLPFVAVEISVNNRRLVLDNVLLDTGSGGSIFPADRLLDLGLKPSVDDELHVISGVGGSEYAFSKFVDSISIGEIKVENFRIEVGAMDYGFEIDGILGMSFLVPIGAVIDMGRFILSVNL